MGCDRDAVLRRVDDCEFEEGADVSAVETPGNVVVEDEKPRSVGVAVEGLFVRGASTTCLAAPGCCEPLPVIVAHISEARPSGSVELRLTEAVDDSLVLGRDGEARVL